MNNKEIELILNNINAEYQGIPFLIFHGKNDTGHYPHWQGINQDTLDEYGDPIEYLTND